jgi:hypothetical protein
VPLFSTSFLPLFFNTLILFVASFMLISFRDRIKHYQTLLHGVTRNWSHWIFKYLLPCSVRITKFI